MSQDEQQEQDAAEKQLLRIWRARHLAERWILMDTDELEASLSQVRSKSKGRWGKPLKAGSRPGKGRNWAAHEDLTDEQIRYNFSDWDIPETLRDNEEIRGFLIEALTEAPSDLPFLSDCFIYAVQARTVNQLVKETGADRFQVRRMFDNPIFSDPNFDNRDVLERVAKSFGVCMPESEKSGPEPFMLADDDPEYCLEKAVRGNTFAQLHIGDMYLKGLNVPMDKSKAAEWLQKSAEQGNGMAMCRLGEMYFNGDGFPQDFEKALEWWNKAAEADNADAMRHIGEMYETGVGVPKNLTKAVEWYFKSLPECSHTTDTLTSLMFIAMENGLPPLGSDLDMLLSAAKSFGSGHGNGVKAKEPVSVGPASRSVKDAVGWWQKTAEQCQRDAERGDADAQYKLAALYESGKGVPEDSERANEWYKKAAKQCHRRAEQGDTDAQCRLADMYWWGQGVLWNVAWAETWYLRAAEAGSARSQFLLGEMYRDRADVDELATTPQDLLDIQDAYANAAEWYTKAAEQGHAAAQCKLGEMYFFGEGFSEDSEKAVEWWKCAAEQGYADAQYNLGMSYEYGSGVPVDKAKAIEWYRRAAEQGHSAAQERLESIEGGSADAP